MRLPPRRGARHSEREGAGGYVGEGKGGGEIREAVPVERERSGDTVVRKQSGDLR